ncbi:glycosyltransferase family 2 protein [Spirosoma oryzicola]|uniref:glycosyltransferase family 2 protein n=1 Tax=Spirosoma oryzicola TaxID=2898794 RepID=UPI001E65063F|nr:glycosyltransferase family 2 protein [Spirosoma oryzicola]UHG91717.1 glycosyltransferase [Spirosoma oryzicola]
MVSVIIPTYNAAVYLPMLFEQLKSQTLPHELIIIDSGSTDNTREIIVNEEGITLIKIDKTEFNHGATRNLGLSIARSEIAIFLTQDALPVSPNTLENLISMLTSSTDIAMAYGRQLPYPDTKIFGRFARLTNYPPTSIVKTKDLIPQMGIKTCSCSNSFAAYYKKDLQLIGGFPTNTILGEDVSAAARFILQGKGVAYCAEAEVLHSHDYSILEEFKRYFDIGVFHNEQRNVLREFSNAESEGLKYVIQEWQYLKDNGHTGLIPSQIFRTIAKYAGYRLGNWEEHLPIALKRKISMHRSFWK